MGLAGIALQHVGLREGAAAALHIGENPVAALAFDGFDSVGELLLIDHEKLSAPRYIGFTFLYLLLRGAATRASALSSRRR